MLRDSAPLPVAVSCDFSLRLTDLAHFSFSLAAIVIHLQVDSDEHVGNPAGQVYPSLQTQSQFSSCFIFFKFISDVCMQLCPIFNCFLLSACLPVSCVWVPFSASKHYKLTKNTEHMESVLNWRIGGVLSESESECLHSHCKLSMQKN